MTTPTRRVAVILNKNARRYTAGLEQRARRIVGADNVFATDTMQGAKAAVGEILAGGYDVIFAGGGDGTIVSTISAIKAALDAGAKSPVPPIGVLKLGTGNAWTYALGVKGGLSQLAHVVRGGHFSTAEYSLIKVGDLLCPFAGMGWDAHVLNDYYDLNKQYKHTPLAPFLNNLFGYFLASATRTIPKFLGGRNLPEVEITCIGQKLYKPDRRGNYFPIIDRKNCVIYHGPASVVAAGTIPYFGYKLRVFPFAGKVPGTMHLRIANTDVADALWHLRGFWKGTHFSSDIIDFLSDGVRITYSTDQPIEVGGDPKGYTRSVDFTISDFTVTIVAFWGA